MRAECSGGMRWDSGMMRAEGGQEEMLQPRDRGMETGVRRGDAAAVGPRDESGARLLLLLLL